MIQSALVATVTNAYSQFGAIAVAALEMTAAQAGVELRQEDRDAIAEQLRRLPAHAEVPGALERLRAAGLRPAALTNATEQVARAQLQHAGLIDAFELVLSADAVRRLKPAPEPYRMAAERMGVTVGGCGWSRRTPGTLPARCGRAAPPRSWPAPARCSTRWSSHPTSPAATSPRSPTASSPPTREPAAGHASRVGAHERAVCGAPRQGP
jgi:Haloacid dehalogenase-like hydrolase